MKYKVELVANPTICDCGYIGGETEMFDYAGDWKMAIDEFYKKTSDENIGILKVKYGVDYLHLIVTTVSGELIHMEPVF